MRIVTSIAPQGLVNQQRAVASWQRLGFKVVSMNCRGEIEILSESFPDVDFMEVHRDGSQVTGRPLVYFDDILDYYRSLDDAICGIVNSDIVLKYDEGFCRIVVGEAVDGLVYGSRVDVDTIGDRTGSVYRGRFDFFFFPRCFLDMYPQSDFMLGMPWWDRWVPTVALLKGVSVKRLETQYAFHERHEVHYSESRFLSFGREFAAHLQKLLPESGPPLFLSLITPESMEVETLGVDVIRFLERYSVPITRAQLDAVLYNEKGEKLFQDGDLRGALGSFNQALSVSPDDIRALNNLAVLSWQLDNRSAAEVFVCKAHACAPTDRTTVFNFTDIQMALNHREMALGACQRYLESCHDDDEMHQREAELRRSIEFCMGPVREALLQDL